MKNDLLIACTCAENNCNYYFDRIRKWYEQLQSIQNADFKVFVDGSVTPPEDLTNKGIEFINLTTKLGRKTISNFPGWKRSFREELKLANEQYDFFVHIENDVKIYNLPLIESYFRKLGYFMSYCSRHCFLESNVMILNDKSQNQKIIDFYSKPEHLNENIDFETSMGRLITYTRVFKSDRVDGKKDRIKDGYDFLAQYF